MKEEKGDKICPLMSCMYEGGGYVNCAKGRCMFWEICTTLVEV